MPSLQGLILTLAAQYLRSLAMATAAANFSHLIVYTKAPSHSLVRTGIYAWSRHPSYVAFFYWALGTQIFIANPVSFFAFSIILYRFFSHRIKGTVETSRLLPRARHPSQSHNVHIKKAYLGLTRMHWNTVLCWVLFSDMTASPVEEWYLVKFFGDDYTKYQQEVPARIPFIR